MPETTIGVPDGPESPLAGEHFAVNEISSRITNDVDNRGERERTSRAFLSWHITPSFAALFIQGMAEKEKTVLRSCDRVAISSFFC